MPICVQPSLSKMTKRSSRLTNSDALVMSTKAIYKSLACSLDFSTDEQWKWHQQCFDPCSTQTAARSSLLSLQDDVCKYLSSYTVVVVTTTSVVTTLTSISLTINGHDVWSVGIFSVVQKMLKRESRKAFKRAPPYTRTSFVSGTGHLIWWVFFFLEPCQAHFHRLDWLMI